MRDGSKIRKEIPSAQGATFTFAQTIPRMHTDRVRVRGRVRIMEDFDDDGDYNGDEEHEHEHEYGDPRYLAMMEDLCL